MTEILEKPLFRSLDQCLRWAWRHEPRMVKQAAIMQLAGKDDREGAQTEAEEKEPAPPRVLNFDLDPKPFGIDGAAQQGLLKSFVNRQPIPERLHLIAKYATRDERRDAQRALRDYLLPLVNASIKPRHMIYMLVSRFYGRPVAFKELAIKIEYLMRGTEPEERMREAWRFVRATSHDVDDLLKSLATRCEETAYSELRQRGVIA